MDACHTQEQEKYRSYMFYVGIFQLFLYFCVVQLQFDGKIWNFLKKLSQMVFNCVNNDVPQQSQD